jgi:hypothetical protein
MRAATTASIVHSSALAPLGMAAPLPWLGPFFAAMTPISPAYIGAILWVPGGYFVGCVAALLFTGVNLGIGRSALAQRRALTGR